MSDVRTRAQEALDDLTASMDGRPEGGVKPLSVAIPAARNALRDLLAENTQLETENDRLISIEFAHAGCDFLRRKDNEYLIGRAEAAEAKISAALKAMNEGRLYGPVRKALSTDDA